MTQVITRKHAANLLRQARLVRQLQKMEMNDDHPSGECIGMAFAALADHSCVLRMKIDDLLSSQQYDSADALLARRLMQTSGKNACRRNDSLLRLRFARSLFEQGRAASAEIELARVLDQRPQSVAALTLAADMASRKGDHRTAVAHLLLAADEKPRREHVRAQLVQTMLNAGFIQHAAAELGFMKSPSPVLVARVLRAQHRTLEAIELLEHCLQQTDASTSAASFSADEILEDLIDALESVGDKPRLKNLLATASITDITTIVRAAKAALWLGDPQRAIAMLELARKESDFFTMEARTVLLVAKVLDAGLGSGSISSQVLVDAPREERLTRIAAQTWLRSILGWFHNERAAEIFSGADPKVHVMTPLLRHSLQVFDRAMDRGDGNKIANATWQLHRDVCKQALEMHLQLHKSDQYFPESETREFTKNTQPQSSLRHAA